MSSTLFEFDEENDDADVADDDDLELSLDEVIDHDA